MSQVVSFEDYRPPARFDDDPWTAARIYEGATSVGPWSLIDTKALDPLDDDPADPASRDFSTDQASDTAGLWYRVIFIDAAANVSAPTDPVQNIAGSPYVSRDELKELLALDNESFADSAIDIAVEAASRAIDGYKHTRFYPSVETRYYTPDPAEDYLDLDDLVTLTTLSVDTAGDRSYATEWTEGTDFDLDPANAALEGRPSRSLCLIPGAGARFPRFRRSIKVEGTFGWATAPMLVKQAAVLIANRLLARTRSAPLGVLIATSNEMVATAHVGGLDLDATKLLDLIPGAQTPSLRSVQLG